MRKTVSASAREKLMSDMALEASQRGISMNTVQCNALVQLACEWYEAQNTFSDVIVDDQQKKQCPTCEQLYCIYPINLRKPLMSVLRKMSLTHKRYLPSELIDEFPAATRSRKFYQMRHWGLVDRDEEGKYYLTDRGYEFAYGQIAIPSKLWVFLDKVVDPPEGKSNGESVFIHELIHVDYSDRREHVQRAVGALSEGIHPDQTSLF